MFVMECIKCVFKEQVSVNAVLINGEYKIDPYASWDVRVVKNILYY
jgi:hypothetical protein